MCCGGGFASDTILMTEEVAMLVMKMTDGDYSDGDDGGDVRISDGCDGDDCHCGTSGGGLDDGLSIVSCR